MFIIIDHDCLMVKVSPEAAKMFGYTVAEMQGQPLDMLVPEALRHHHNLGITRYLTSPVQRADLRVQAERADCRIVPISVSLVPQENGTILANIKAL